MPPPNKGKAVKTIFVPWQMAPDGLAVIPSDGVMVGNTVRVRLPVYGLPVAHAIFDVRTQDTTSPLSKPEIIQVLLVAPPIFTEFFCH